MRPRPLRPLLLAAASLLAACAPGITATYQDTRPLCDPLTNVAVGVSPLGHPACVGLLPPDRMHLLEAARPDAAPASWAFREPPRHAICAPDAPVVRTSPPRSTATGRADFTIVNTDIDDTLFPSLWDRERYPSHQPYPGVLALIAAQGEAVQVLTARPPPTGALRSKICDLFSRELRDSSACEGLSVSPGELGSLLDTLGMGLVKAEALLHQRCDHPDAATVFNGDSGQGDWIAALIARDLDPGGVLYATIHDVRAWSPEHRRRLLVGMAESRRLEAIYRRALPPADGEPPAEHQARLRGRLDALRRDVDAALGGRDGRLDGALLRARGIFLFRNHAELALDLAAAGFVDRRAAARVARLAAPDLCFVPDGPFGFDDPAARRRLLERIAGAAPRPGDRD